MRVRSRHGPRRRSPCARPGELNCELESDAARHRPTSSFRDPKSALHESSKILRPPRRMTETSFSLVLEEFVERGEHESGPAGDDAQLKIDLVVATLCLAMPNHSKQTAVDMEIRCANNTSSHGEACPRFARNVIADPGQHFV